MVTSCTACCAALESNCPIGLCKFEGVTYVHFAGTMSAGVTAPPSSLAMLSSFSNMTRHGCQLAVDAEEHLLLCIKHLLLCIKHEYYSGVSYQLKPRLALL